MIRYITKWVAFISLSLILSSPLPSSRLWAQDEGRTTGALPDGGWPQVIQGENTITIYQPQIESWNDGLLKARSAVSIATKASAQPEFGVVFFSARTSVDRSSGTVDLAEISISSVKFPKSDKDALELRRYNQKQHTDAGRGRSPWTGSWRTWLSHRQR